GLAVGACRQLHGQELPSHQRVEAARRLVEDQELGLVHERLEQPPLLPVALRQAADLLVEIEVESLGETFDAVPADATAEVPQVGQELACRLVPVDREVARQVSDTPSQLHALGAGIEPQHGDLAGVGAEEVQEEAYRRRLAGAV